MEKSEETYFILCKLYHLAYLANYLAYLGDFILTLEILCRNRLRFLLLYNYYVDLVYVFSRSILLPSFLALLCCPPTFIHVHPSNKTYTFNTLDRICSTVLGLHPTVRGNPTAHCSRPKRISR